MLEFLVQLLSPLSFALLEFDLILVSVAVLALSVTGLVKLNI